MPNLSQAYAPSPESLPQLFKDAWMARDAESLANLFAEDAEFVNVVGLWWHNRSAIWKAHEYGLRKIFSQSTLEIRQVRVKQISEETAVVHARMKLSGQSSAGGVLIPGHRFNIISMVAQKKEKGWICVSAHNTDIVPGVETNLIDAKGNMRSVDYRKEPD